MSRRGIDIRGRDRHRDSSRYPPPPPPPALHRERMRGGSSPPHKDRMRGFSPPRSHRDRLRGDSRGQNGHYETSRRASRSPVRNSHHRFDEDIRPFQARSPDGHRRRSLELRPRRDSSRERRMRSPRMAARTPPPPLPPPPPRSPRMCLASPRGSLRPPSPRMLMRPGSPQLTLLPLSPRAPLRPLSPLRPVQMPSTLAAALDRELDRQARDAVFPSSRNGNMLGIQSSTSLGPGSKVQGVGDLHNAQQDESLSSSGLLVPRSIVLEDGTVGTFYSLPPDPLSSTLTRTADTGLGAKVLPPYPEGLKTQLTSEPEALRFTSPEKYISIERSKVDYLVSQDQRFSDRPVQSQYSTRERTFPEYSTFQRERPLSPLQRRKSRSPLHAGIRSFSRDSMLREAHTPPPRRINYDKRGSVFVTDISSREGFSSPGRHGFDGDYRKVTDRDMIGYGMGSKGDEFLRIPEAGRISSHRHAPSVYDPPSRLVQSPERRERLMYEVRNDSFHRHNGSPSREPPRHNEAFSQGRSTNRSDMGRFPSPNRIRRMSPRRLRSLTPPRRSRSLTPPSLRRVNFHEEERRAWKRKMIEMSDEPPLDRRIPRFREPEFKRRERDGDVHYDDQFRGRRPSGWDIKDGWPERGVDGPRPWRERGGSPGRYPDDQRRLIEINVRPSVDRARQWHAFDNRREKRQRDEQQIAPDLPEDSVEFKQQVQRALLKYAKMLNEDPGQRKVYEEQGKAGTLLCLACGRLSKPFVDTHSLVMHTFESKKKGLRAEHSGLCKAICSLMGWSSTIEPVAGKSYQNISAEEGKANKEDLILWPPTVVVHNVFARKTIEGQKEATAEAAVKELLKDAGLSFERIKVALGKQGTVIIKYLPVLSCLHDAEHLHKHFVMSGRGRDEWAYAKLDKEESAGDGDLDKEKKEMLYGYLALATDLDKVDLELLRRCQVRSRKEIAAIAGDSPADKKASD